MKEEKEEGSKLLIVAATETQRCDKMLNDVVNVAVADPEAAEH